MAFQARGERKVDKRSGVSQRLPISVLETVVSNAERRALSAGESPVVPRVTDVYAALPSMTGKFELEYEGELKGADQVARELVRGAVSNVFSGYFGDADLKQVVEWFDLGGSLSLSDTTSAASLVEQTARVQGLAELARRAGIPDDATAPQLAAGIDFVLEGMCAQKKISRSDERGYHAVEPARRPQAQPQSRTPVLTPDDEEETTGGGKKKKVLQLMKYKYTKYVPNLLDDLDMDELMSKLSELLLSSGFGNPRDPSDDGDRTMQALHDAILEALFSGGVLPDDLLERIFGDEAAEGSDGPMRDQLEELIQQIVERMKESGYITTPPDLDGEKARRAQGGGEGEGEPGEVKFEVTDKALDFLGYRALRDLLGSSGHSSPGRHDTRDLSTGIDASGAPKPYEFGDTMNLDATATIMNTVQRTGNPADVDYPDLMVAQGEYQSSCATVLMLDCSHSMILYGEDRFTPAKRVAMALSHLIRTQFPGDTLHAVLFHDSAEEIPLRELGRVRVGPYYTNTREGLRVARRILERQRKDMRQIVDDHRRQAVGAHAARRAHLQEPVRPRPVRDRRDAGGGVGVREGGHHDQHLHARARLRPGGVRPPRGRDVPRQGVFHDALHAGRVRADGLHGQEDEDGPLGQVPGAKGAKGAKALVPRCLGLRCRRAAPDAPRAPTPAPLSTLGTLRHPEITCCPLPSPSSRCPTWCCSRTCSCPCTSSSRGTGRWWPTRCRATA